MIYSPLKITKSLRKRMIKNEKCLIPRIEDSGQEAGNKKVVDAYFRYKDYMKNPEWFVVSLKEVWSPKFIGLVDNIHNAPINRVKKLEFQNPAYSAGFRLNKDPRDYSRVFAVQVSGCDYDCNYCYVPRSINVANPKMGEYFSAQEIMDHFVKAREKSYKPLNVIRITGGNPTIIPEMIVDIYKEIEKRKLDVYLWIDSNLSTPEYLENIGKELMDILSQNNVGVIGCFKGVCEEDFHIITGCPSENYKLQFETAKWFVDNGADFYLYVPALVYGENIKKKLEGFIERLRVIGVNLPLRVEMLEIIDYPGAIMNEERARKVHRPMPSNDQRIVFDLWYNQLLPRIYSKKELDKYCCQIPLRKKDS